MGYLTSKRQNNLIEILAKLMVIYIISQVVFNKELNLNKRMGADFCNGGTGGPGMGLKPLSDIYLSNPQNISRSQIQKSAEFKLSDSANQFLGLSQTSVILGCKEDQNRELLNKYVLTYLYFLKNKTGDAQVQIKDFIKLLNIWDESSKYANQISAFQSQYIKKLSPREKSQYLINEYFKNGYFSSAIQQFPLYSFDPSIIGYARRPLIDLSKGIKSKYEKQAKKKQMYCVIQVTKDQQKLLNKMANSQDYFTFGTFIRCFSSEDKAKKRQKQLQKIGKNVRQTHKINPSTLFLNIQIPSEQVDKDYDYGFYQDESQKDNPLGDIIMNILNFLQVTGAQPQEKTYDLKYNGLARLIHLKRARLLQTEPQLIKVTSLIQGQCQQIKSHSCLLRLVTSRRLSITASQSLKESINLPGASEDNERVNLIEAYIEEKDFDKALQQCKDTLQFKVRKAQIYYEAKKYEQAQSIIKALEPSKSTLKAEHFKEYILLEFMSAKLKKIKGETKSAEKQLRTLSEAMKKEYRGFYEYRGRQVERQLAECEGVKESGVKWEKYGDGLNIGVMLSH